MLTLLALGWYNWARFGSVLETGLRYILNFRDLNRSIAEAFSIYHFLPSLWMFLFQPFQTLSSFPFIAATYGTSPSFLYLGPVNLYHAEAITGLLFSVPFGLFSAVAAANTLRALFGRRRLPGIYADDANRRLLWLSLGLAGAAVLPFLVVLFYYTVAIRFIAEFLPSLMLLAVLGLWQGYVLLEGKSARRLVYTSSAIVLGALTVAISLLLTIAEFYDQLRL